MVSILGRCKIERFIVYLGKHIDNSKQSYENVAKNQEGAVVFNMDPTEWENLARKYTKPGMWILNKFFLEYCISKDCDFVLTTAPDPYCIRGVIAIGKETDFYAQELGYIYSRGYIWEAGVPAYTRVSR